MTRPRCMRLTYREQTCREVTDYEKHWCVACRAAQRAEDKKAGENVR
jgi:hypothetical protein